MRYILIAVITACIGIIKIESEVKALININSKFGVYMVFAVSHIATLVICDIGIWRKCIHKQKLVWLFIDKTIWLCKYEVFAIGTVCENTVLACGIVASCCVVVAVETIIEGGVHKQVWQRVGFGRDNIAQSSVYCPNIYAFWYNLVLSGVFIVFIEVFASLAYVATLVNLIELTVILSTYGYKCK